MVPFLTRTCKSYLYYCNIFETCMYFKLYIIYDNEAVSYPVCSKSMIFKHNSAWTRYKALPVIVTSALWES